MAPEPGALNREMDHWGLFSLGRPQGALRLEGAAAASPLHFRYQRPTPAPADAAHSGTRTAGSARGSPSGVVKENDSF